MALKSHLDFDNFHLENRDKAPYNETVHAQEMRQYLRSQLYSSCPGLL